MRNIAGFFYTTTLTNDELITEEATVVEGVNKLLRIAKRLYYRRPRGSYYTMSLFEGSTSVGKHGQNFLFTVCFLDFVTVFNLAYCLC